MGSDNNLVTLSKTEFELIKSKLVDLPKELFARIMTIAQAIDDIQRAIGLKSLYCSCWISRIYISGLIRGELQSLVDK